MFAIKSREQAGGTDDRGDSRFHLVRALWLQFTLNLPQFGPTRIAQGLP